MRISVRLDDQLLADAKRYGAKSERTPTSLIDEGLRIVPAQRVAVTAADPV